MTAPILTLGGEGSSANPDAALEEAGVCHENQEWGVVLLLVGNFSTIAEMGEMALKRAFMRGAWRISTIPKNFGEPARYK